MFRRCVSTVFWLRNSVGGDLGVRPAIDDEPGELELTFGERLDPGCRRPCPPRVRRWTPCPSLRSSCSASCRYRSAPQAASAAAAVSSCSTARSRSPACASARPARRRETAASSIAAGPLGGDGRREGALGGRSRVAVGERDGGRSPLGPGDARAEAGLRRDGGREAGRPLGLVDAPERDPAARQQLEVFRPPAPRQVRQLLSSGRRDEQLGGLLRVAALHAGDRER